MKPLILVVVLLMLIVPVAAPQGRVEITYDREFSPKDAVPEEHDSGGDKNSRDGQSHESKIEEVQAETNRILDLLKVADAAFDCCLSIYAPNTPGGKLLCSKEAKERLADVEPIKNKQERDLVQERLDERERLEITEAGKYTPRFPRHYSEISVQIRPSEFGLTHCNFSAISTDGNATNFRAASYNQAGTQQLVDNLRVIDPQAEIYFNDPKITGVKPDNAPEHDGQIQVAWSSEPLSPAGVELLYKSNPVVVQLFLETAPDKREEALEEYKAFDFTLAKAYLRVCSNTNLQAALKALKEREEFWRKEALNVLNPDYFRKNGKNHVEDLQELYELGNKINCAWEREKSDLIVQISIYTLECLQIQDSVAIETVKKAFSSCDNEKMRELVEFNFPLECAKNHDLVALMAALKALEEKLCEPSEAQRRKECREAKAAERRKARYEAAKAKIESELKAKLEKERMERSIRFGLYEQQKYKIYDQKGNRD